ncbi:hypothetical protein [Taklimakanibacter deserti]|uniref:hypothetical protein n=1 Tax=Taklimakanibacter deserti TaxID=2267839 RepID=UPI000E65AEA3
MGYGRDNDASINENYLAAPRVIEASQNPRSPCGLDIEVSGGTFSPDVCQFEIVSGGAICADPKACSPDYVISLKTSRPGSDEIISVVLFNIREFKTGVYKFDPGTGSTDFKGQLTDKNAVARHLLRGAITLDRRGDDKVQIVCDVHFATDIVVRASGLVDVKRLNAP